MITATVTKTEKGRYLSFRCTGHAGYADKGSDIICAATSILVINMINSIEKFSDSTVEIGGGEVTSIRFIDEPDEKANVLMDSLVLGLTGIMNEYGKKYLKLVFEEV